MLFRSLPRFADHVQQSFLFVVDFADDSVTNDRRVFHDDRQRRSKLVRDIVDRLLSRFADVLQLFVLLFQSQFAFAKFDQQLVVGDLHGLAFHRMSDRTTEQFATQKVFDDVVLCPEPNRFNAQLGARRTRQNDDRRFGNGLMQRFDALQSRAIGQRQIGEDHIEFTEVRAIQRILQLCLTMKFD